MRARGMQVLTDQIKAKRPGVVVYGIGDEEHQQHTSGHNEDDTAGVSAEDQDADSTPEHRAIDVMPGTGSFTEADGDRLTHDLTSDPANRARLIYVNWKDKQYHRKNNWAPVPHSDYHSHVHVSGEADADENVSRWNLSNWDPINVQGEDMDADQNAALKSMWGLWEEVDTSIGVQPVEFTLAINRIEAVLAELAARPPVASAPVDQATVTAAVIQAMADPQVLSTIAKAVTDEIGS